MSVGTHTELKGLQTRLQRAEAELKSFQEQRGEVDRKIADLCRQLRDLNQRIQAIKDSSKDLIVSEHAYCRYFERVLGYDLKELAKQMVPDDVQEQIKILGAGRFPVGDTHKVLVKNNVVTSVVGKDEE